MASLSEWILNLFKNDELEDTIPEGYFKFKIIKTTDAKYLGITFIAEEITKETLFDALNEDSEQDIQLFNAKISELRTNTQLTDEEVYLKAETWVRNKKDNNIFDNTEIDRISQNGDIFKVIIGNYIMVIKRIFVQTN